MVSLLRNECVGATTLVLALLYIFACSTRLVVAFVCLTVLGGEVRHIFQ